MPGYHVERDVDASPAQVWQVLTGSDLAGPDTGVTKVDGDVADGARITVHSAVAPGRAFPVRVALDEPGRVMTWTGGMPLGLFRGVRTFAVQERDGGARFVMHEEFSGPLLPLIWRSMPDLTGSFETFADGVRARAESPAVRG